MLRRMVLIAFTASLAFSLLATPGMAQRKLKWSEAGKFFKSMRGPNIRLADAEPTNYKVKSTKVGGERLEIAGDVDIDEPMLPDDPKPCKMGIKVWFQLAATGKFVNPTKHRWNPKEELYIWLEPAVPVQVSIHQNYPEDVKKSKHIYPDPKHPKTFSTIFPKPGGVRLPVKFRTDDDLRKEIISLVLVRSDSGTLPVVNALAKDNNSGTSGDGGSLRLAMAEQVKQETKMNNEATSTGKIKGEDSRLTIVGPDNDQELSSDFEDVAFFMFGHGTSHQFQLTLNK